MTGCMKPLHYFNIVLIDEQRKLKTNVERFGGASNQVLVLGVGFVRSLTNIQLETEKKPVWCRGFSFRQALIRFLPHLRTPHGAIVKEKCGQNEYEFHSSYFHFETSNRCQELANTHH